MSIYTWRAVEACWPFPQRALSSTFGIVVCTLLKASHTSARFSPNRKNNAAWEVTAGGIDASAAFEGVRAQAGLIGYLAVVTTALTNWMQAVGQRNVPAERAAVIYAMDPVYAAGFAYLLLGETLGPAGLVGAGIITGAALWSQGTQMAAADGGGGDGGDAEGQGGEEHTPAVVEAAEEERSEMLG